MGKLLALLALASWSLFANADTFSITLLPDAYKVIQPNETIAGSTSAASGYSLSTVSGQPHRNFVYSATYTWRRTNTDGVAYQGYTVTITATDPVLDSGNFTYFPNPAVVTFSGVAEGSGGGSGNGG